MGVIGSLDLNQFELRKKTMIKIHVIDTETTGLVEPIQPTEVAYIEIAFPSLEILGRFDNFYKPTKPIEYGAKATAHILGSDLVNCAEVNSPVFDEEVRVIREADYIIGHNCDYDWKVLGSPDVKRIDTKALASKLVKNIDSYSQSALLYYFFGDSAREMVRNAHNALCDVENCLKLLEKLLEEYEKQYDEPLNTIEDLWEFSEYCRIPEKMTFGKHKGKTYTEVCKEDYSYFLWWCTKSDTKPDEYQLKAIQLAKKEVFSK